MDSYT